MMALMKASCSVNRVTYICCIDLLTSAFILFDSICMEHPLKICLCRN